MLLTASETPTVVSTLTTALESVASQMTDGITAVLPVALSVVGMVMVVTFGVRFFRKIAGRA